VFFFFGEKKNRKIRVEVSRKKKRKIYLAIILKTKRVEKMKSEKDYFIQMISIMLSE
jgi:hypothetical protein